MAPALDVGTLSRACDLADGMLSGVRQDQLTLATPCAEWVVRDLMEHIVAATDFFADVAELGASPEAREWPNHTPEELAPSFRRHAERLLSAFESDGAMERAMLLPTGPTAGSICIQVALGEIFVHSWDLQPLDGAAVRERGHSRCAPDIRLDTAVRPRARREPSSHRPGSPCRRRVAFHRAAGGLRRPRSALLSRAVTRARDPHPDAGHSRRAFARAAQSAQELFGALPGRREDSTGPSRRLPPGMTRLSLTYR